VRTGCARYARRRGRPDDSGRPRAYHGQALRLRGRRVPLARGDHASRADVAARVVAAAQARTAGVLAGVGTGGPAAGAVAGARIAAAVARSVARAVAAGVAGAVTARVAGGAAGAGAVGVAGALLTEHGALGALGARRVKRLDGQLVQVQLELHGCLRVGVLAATRSRRTAGTPCSGRCGSARWPAPAAVPTASRRWQP